MKNKRFKSLCGILFSAVLLTQFSCSELKNELTKSDLEANRDLWLESKIKNYKMTIKIDKPGHATPSGKFIITVRDAVPVSIVSYDKPDVDLRDSIVRFENYDTVDDIFNFIESSENEQNWDRHEIEYDSKYGFPKKVDLDQAGVLDEELYFEVLEFEVLQ